MTQQETTCSSGACPIAKVLWSRRGTVIWVIVAAVALMLWWPILKGTYYKSFGKAPPADGIAWRTDLDAALGEAQAAGKPVLIDVTADWCPPCQVMKHEVWPSPDVRQAIEQGYIPGLADVDTPAGRAIGGRYSASVIPTLLVVDGQGEVLRRGSFMSRRELLEFLQQG